MMSDKIKPHHLGRKAILYPAMNYTNSRCSRPSRGA